MTYKNYIDRSTGEIFAYDMDDEYQIAAIKPGLESLSDEERVEIIAAQEASRAPTADQILQAANAKRDELLVVAGLRIAPLQDAVDLDEATAGDVANLKLWKQYRIAVNRVSSTPGYPASVVWPAQPS